MEALPEDLRAEVLASQQAQPIQPPTYAPPSADDIDPEFLAALPPDIQAEVLAQQRAQRVAQQAEGQPVDMDNASIIATFPADLREEVWILDFISVFISQYAFVSEFDHFSSWVPGSVNLLRGSFVGTPFFIAS